MKPLIAVMLVTLAACKKDPPPTPSAASSPAATTTPPPVKGECDDVDDSNLSAVVECFYRAKNPMSRRRFYSHAALAEESAEETAKTNLSNTAFSNVRISKEETVAGQQFAAVSRTARATGVPDGSTACSETNTRTWVRENGKWRFLGGYASVEELTRRKFQDGDFTGAAEAAEQWLKVDPLSIDAYKQLGFAVKRGAPGKPVGDVARAVLSIDAKNSTALFLAVGLAKDPDVAESYLGRFVPDDCSLQNAVFNVATAFIEVRRPKEALRVLDEHPSQGLLLPRIQTLALLGRAKEAAKLLTAEVQTGLESELNGNDPAYVASWCGNIAAVFIDAGDKKAARRWIDFGLLKDPNDKRLAALLRMVKK